MVKIMFVCHGNICRSPMAEFIMKDLVKKKNTEHQFYIASSATSTEELGNPVHRGTYKKLKEAGITPEGKYAVRLKRGDYYKYDYILGMDSRNLKNMQYILGDDDDRKLGRLLDYTDQPRDIADPWYTGNFDITYQDIVEGCNAFYHYLVKEGKVIEDKK